MYCGNCGKAHNGSYVVDGRSDLCSRECWRAMHAETKTVQIRKPRVNAESKVTMPEIPSARSVVEAKQPSNVCRVKTEYRFVYSR